MAFLTDRKSFRNVYILLSALFLCGGIAPVFSQEILATYGVGAQLMNYEQYERSGDRELGTWKGMMWNVDVVFIGASGLAVSTEIGMVTDFDDVRLLAPLIGAGYVYYNQFYAGAIWKTLLDAERYILQVPTLVAGYDFGPVLLGAQLSYVSSFGGTYGFRFAIGVGIKAGNSGR
jgi:hypothetical protein